MVSIPPSLPAPLPSSGAGSKHPLCLGHAGEGKESPHNRSAVVQRILEDADLGGGILWGPTVPPLKSLLCLRLGSRSHICCQLSTLFNLLLA